MVLGPCLTDNLCLFWPKLARYQLLSSGIMNGWLKDFGIMILISDFPNLWLVLSTYKDASRVILQIVASL